MKGYITLKSGDKDYVALPEGEQTLWVSLDIFLARQASEAIKKADLPKDSIGYKLKKYETANINGFELNLSNLVNQVNYKDCIKQNVFDFQKYQKKVIDYVKSA